MMRRAAFLLLVLVARVAAADEDVFTGVDRVVAVGDIHGDHDQLVAVLQSAGLIDAQRKWCGGKIHLVQTGDVVDRGPESRRAMDLLMRLEVEAREAGGAVHALIGNHESMVLYGDLRYVSAEEIEAFKDENSEKTRDEAWREHQEELKKRLGADAPKFDDDYRRRWNAENPLGFVEFRRAFSPAGVYGKWIRGHNVTVKIDGTLFLHGGISPKYAGWTVRKINEQARVELSDFAQLEGGLVKDERGPLWYRGLALDGGMLEKHVQTVLKNYNVERIAIGHTFTDGTIVPRFGGRVLQIDVGLCRLYDPKLRQACLVLERGTPHVLHRGKKLELPLDEGKDLLRYFKQAAALDPEPSGLKSRIAELEARFK